jgi:SPP1 family phage portal protein
MESYINGYFEPTKEFYLPAETEITDELVTKLIKLHEEDCERYITLEDYYRGKAKIYDRSKEDYKANNKLALDYPSYIVDILLGLFVGKPISYTVAEENAEMMEGLQEVFDLNDEQDENAEIAKICGIKGRGYEIVYLDEEGGVRFNEVQPENIVMVYDNHIKPEPLFCIYIREDADAESIGKESKNKLVTLYTKDSIKEMRLEGSDLKLIEENANLFGAIPVVEFKNNNEAIGDFERVLSLIDALNLAQSDTANDFEEFTDALLVLAGMPQADSDDVNRMIEDKVLLLDKSGGAGQSAEWLIKDINDTALENYKNRLDADIHKFAKVPNMNDEHFAGNVSGEAMKYKLFATDQIIAQKQRKFKSALQERIKLILSIAKIKTAKDFDYRDISIVFNDNKPYNELDNIATVKAALDAGLSKTYAYGKLRDIDDVAEELERQEQEKDAYADEFMQNADKDLEDGE